MPIRAAALAFGFVATTCVANERPNCFKGHHADWHDENNWSDKVAPNQSGDSFVINQGNSAVVSAPFDGPIRLTVGNSRHSNPSGILTLNADFQIEILRLAIEQNASGLVQQTAGRSTFKTLLLASGLQGHEPTEAIYNLEGGTLSADDIQIGLTGPASLNLSGSGEVVTAQKKLQIGSHAQLGFKGGKAGFPSVNGVVVTVEPGAVLRVESDGTATKPGKFMLIHADLPLATDFQVEWVGFAEGKAKLLENEPGIVLEVK